jgi:hypothetical protein
MIKFIKKEYRKFKDYTKNIPLGVRIWFIISILYGGFMTYISSWDEVKYIFIEQDIRVMAPRKTEILSGEGRIEVYRIYNNSGLSLKAMLLEIFSKNNPCDYNSQYFQINAIPPYDVGREEIEFYHNPLNKGKDTVYLNFKSRIDSSLIKTHIVVFDVQ